MPAPIRTLALLTLLAAGGLSLSAQAGLVNAYSADNPANSPTLVDDFLDTQDLGPNNLTTAAVTSAYDFSNAWSQSNGGGIGGPSGEVNPFNGFGGTGTVELFIKTDLTAESLTGDDELVFEAGAQGIGFSLGIVPNTAGGDPLLRFFNNHTEFTLSLATLDDSDFIQVAAAIDESQGATSYVRLTARDANGLTVAATNVFTGNGDIAGSDGLGVFNTDGSGFGQGDSGGTNNNAAIAFDGAFSGQITAFNFYDDAESDATLLASYQSNFAAVIPEPASLALLGLGGLLIAGRRRDG